MKIAMPAGQIDAYPWGVPILVLVDPLAAELRQVYLAGFGAVLQSGVQSEFELANTKAALWADQHAAELVKGIDDTTREKLQELLASALDDPEMSQAALSAEIGDLFGEMAVSRADMIARTETSIASNLGNLGGWRSFGAEWVEVSDGIEDTPCSEANGSQWTIDHAESDPLQHPNCSRSFSYIPTEEVDPALLASPYDE